MTKPTVAIELDQEQTCYLRYWWIDGGRDENEFTPAKALRAIVAEDFAILSEAYFREWEEEQDGLQQ